METATWTVPVGSATVIDPQPFLEHTFCHASSASNGRLLAIFARFQTPFYISKVA